MKYLKRFFTFLLALAASNKSPYKIRQAFDRLRGENYYDPSKDQDWRFRK